MDRKESIKMLLGGSISLPFLKFNKSSSIEKAEQDRGQALSESMHSNWSEWPDMPWVGPAFWGNRLQDWRLIDGNVECAVTASNRSLYSLTHQLDRYKGDFKISVQVNLSKGLGSRNGYVGFRIGAKAKDDPCPVTFEDYRRAAIYGEGLDAGISSDGRLMIGEEKSNRSVATNSAIHLQLKGEAVARAYRLVLTAFDTAGGKRLDRLTVQEIPPGNVAGNIALVSHFPSEGGASGTPSARFSDWRISGTKISGNPDQTYGPVLFSQYTLNQGVLKVTAQLAPMETISGHGISFQIREGKSWKTLRETTVHPLARTAHFRFEKWSYDRDIPYRLRVELPLKSGTNEYFYKGTIAADPVGEDRLKAAVFSCNQEHGFPDTEVVKNVAKHRPHMAMFLGDQFYESFGGFGVERSHNLEMATLDYLRKWYQFGWSYRDIFRDIPSVFIPDDHDVFHGNIWGEGGKAADVSQGFGSESQDSGGYKMLPEWVDMVQRTQTSHLPDPYDPTPVKQDIGVYYTDWIYGGISFAIIEDRKFKTAPANVLPV
ncbi:MAG: hypothetical protein R3281_16785, partial [Balneolaceae bacterium]|nr:hypothetical protein [Balneolaceae bacterium]